MSDDGHGRLLVVRCELGEREAFPELVHLWHDPLWRYVKGMVGSPDTADDLAQEAWVAVVRGLPRLRQPERFAAWLFTIARRTVADHLRQTYRTPPTTTDVETEADGDDSDAGVLTALEIRAGLGGLPPLEREVLLLFHLQDLPLAACAEVLGVPPGTVKRRLHRARRMLRGVLVERGYEACASTTARYAAMCRENWRTLWRLRSRCGPACDTRAWASRVAAAPP